MLWTKAAASCIPEQMRPRFCCGWTCVYRGASGAVAQSTAPPSTPRHPPALKAPFAASRQHQLRAAPRAADVNASLAQVSFTRPGRGSQIWGGCSDALLPQGSVWMRAANPPPPTLVAPTQHDQDTSICSCLQVELQGVTSILGRA